MGLGISAIRNEVFFTKNGSICSKSLFSEGPKLKLPQISNFFPTVCSDTGPISISFNSGQKPFKFDYAAFLVKEANRCFCEINKVEVDKNTIFYIVSAFLYLNGHHDTLISLQDVHRLDKARLIEALHKQRRLRSTAPCKSASIMQAVATENDKREDAESAEASSRSRFISSIGCSLRSFFKKPSLKRDGDKPWVETMEEKQRVEVQTSDSTAFFERSRIRRHLLNNRVAEARELFKSIFGQTAKSEKNEHFFVLFLVLEFLALFQKNQQDSLLFAKRQFVGDTKNKKLTFIGSDNKPQSFEVKVVCSHRGAHVAVRHERRRQQQVPAALHEGVQVLLRRPRQQPHPE